jgi:hypothetical protein
VNIIEAMRDPALFEPWFRGASWNHWRTVLKAAYGMRLGKSELEFFRSVSGGRAPPEKRVRELWICAGRRAGKDSIASLVCAHAAALFDQNSARLRPGERAACLCLASDKDQSRLVLGYTRSYFSDLPLLKAMVTRETQSGFELSNGVDINIATNNFRSVRGRTILCAVLDECAFYRDENSASPDLELYRALVPGMVTLPDAMLIGISTPYRKAGLLHSKWREHFGKDSGDILVIQAPSEVMNPAIDKAMIAAAYEEDPLAAAAEYRAQFRSDIDSFLPLETVEACVERGVTVRPPKPGVSYVGAVDSASGTGKDSFVAAIAHREGDEVVLDLAHEIKPPFNPQAAIAEAAGLFKNYRVTRAVGDKYAAGFVVEGFQRNGITYAYSERDRSAIYLECLPTLTSGRAKLLDNKRLITQFAQLERRTSSSGKDRVDHPGGGVGGSHDDLSNGVALALVEAAQGAPPFVLPPGLLDKLRARGLRSRTERSQTGEIHYREPRVRIY